MLSVLAISCDICGSLPVDSNSLGVLCQSWKTPFSCHQSIVGFLFQILWHQYKQISWLFCIGSCAKIYCVDGCVCARALVCVNPSYVLLQAFCDSSSLAALLPDIFPNSGHMCLSITFWNMPTHLLRAHLTCVWECILCQEVLNISARSLSPS